MVLVWEEGGHIFGTERGSAGDGEACRDFSPHTTRKSTRDSVEKAVLARADGCRVGGRQQHRVGVRAFLGEPGQGPLPPPTYSSLLQIAVKTPNTLNNDHCCAGVSWWVAAAPRAVTIRSSAYSTPSAPAKIPIRLAKGSQKPSTQRPVAKAVATQVAHTGTGGVRRGVRGPCSRLSSPQGPPGRAHSLPPPSLHPRPAFARPKFEFGGMVFPDHACQVMMTREFQSFLKIGGSQFASEESRSAVIPHTP